jgi:hypothetical protein
MCQKCDLVMVLLGKLPGVALRVAVRVIRCYVCNNVISEEWKSVRAPQLAASFISSQACDVAYWHKADVASAFECVCCSQKSGHRRGHVSDKAQVSPAVVNEAVFRTAFSYSS